MPGIPRSIANWRFISHLLATLESPRPGFAANRPCIAEPASYGMFGLRRDDAAEADLVGPAVTRIRSNANGNLASLNAFVLPCRSIVMQIGEPVILRGCVHVSHNEELIVHMRIEQRGVDPNWYPDNRSRTQRLPSPTDGWRRPARWPIVCSYPIRSCLRPLPVKVKPFHVIGLQVVFNIIDKRGALRGVAND